MNPENLPFCHSLLRGGLHGSEEVVESCGGGPIAVDLEQHVGAGDLKYVCQGAAPEEQ